MPLKFLQIRNIGAKGLNTDVAPWDLPPEFITSGVNFRVLNGAVTPNGSDKGWAIPSQSLFTVGLLASVSAGAFEVLLMADTTKVVAFDGSSTRTISPSFGTPLHDPRGWSVAYLGAVPVVNHPELGAMYWYPVGLSTDLAYLPFNQSVTWDAALGKNAKVIRSHRNFLFMLNLTEEVNGVMTEMTDSYRWSHPADANSIPATWDETDLAFSAGLASLGDHTGAIIDGASLRDSFVIYSEGGINVLDYSGDSFVWNRRQVTTTASLLAKDCVVEVLGAHFYLSPGDIMRFDGHSVTSIMQSRIREHLQANLTGQNYKNCIVVSNLAMKEIWFCIPKVGSTWPDLVYVYNWADESWAIRELRENVSYLAYGSKSNPVLTWKALELRDPTPTWQSYDAPWGSATSTPFDDTMLAVTTTGEVYDTDTAVPDGDLHTELKRTDMAFNPHRQVSTITKVHPMIQTSGSVYFSVGSQDYPGGPVRWKPKILLSSKDTHRRLNVRTTGALHAWKLESVANATFTFTGLEIEYSEAGVR